MKRKRIYYTALTSFTSLVCAVSAWSQVAISVDNPGFEDDVLADGTSLGASAGAPAGWSGGYYVTGDLSTWIPEALDYRGALNPGLSDFGGIAPGGDNVAWAETYDGYYMGLSQVLSDTLLPDLTYDLSVQVGNPDGINGGAATADYRIELLAGSTKIMEAEAASPASGTFATVNLPSYVAPSAGDPLLGEPLEIRIMAADDTTTAILEVHFDEVALTRSALLNAIADAGGPYNNGSGSVAPDGSGSLPADGNTISSYEWDLNNDGSYGDTTGVTPGDIDTSVLIGTWDMTFGDNTIGLRVTDSGANVATDTAIVTILAPNFASLDVGFQATVASEQHPDYAGEARFYHVSTNPANPGTGSFAATIVGTNNPAPPFVRNYDGPVVAYKFAGGANNDITAVAQSGGNASIITFTTTDTSFDGFGQGQAKIWTSTDPGSDIEVAGPDPYNVADDVGGTGGWRSLGGATGTIDCTAIPAGSVHIYYGAFNATPSVSVVMRDTDGPHPDVTITDVHSVADGGNGDGANRTEYYLAEIDFVTDGIYDEVEFTWDSDGDGDLATGNGRGIAVVVTEAVADAIAPTLATADIVDDQSGGPFTSTGDSITYTVTYSEFMDPATIDATDFGLSAGSVSATIDSVVHFGGVTTVVVTPDAGTSGTLELQVNATADLRDLAGNALDTAVAIVDDPAVTIVADMIPPTLVSITDNVGGGPILEGQSVIYTVTFDEPMKASSIETTDFEDGGSPGGTINSVSATANPAVFEVVASAAYPAGTGTLTFQIKSDATLEDLSGNLLVTGGSPIPAASITVNAQEAARLVPTIDLPATAGQNTSGTLNLAYDASGSDKLVIIATKEGNSAPFTTLTYEGQPLTLAVSTGSDVDNRHWNGIYYLDDPGSYSDTTSPGIVAVSGTSRNIITAVGLSDTAPGFGGVAAPPAPDNSKSVDLGVNFVDSMVIASHGMGQSGNTANVNNVNTVSPLVEMSAIEAGNNWIGHVTGYAESQGPGLINYSFTGGSTTGVNTIAAEFPGAVIAGGTAYDTWATDNGLTGDPGSATDPDAAADGDGGGKTNLYEFGFNGDPLVANNEGLLYGFIGNADADADDELIFTIAVRTGTAFANVGNLAVSAAVDGIVYTVRGDVDLDPLDGDTLVNVAGAAVFPPGEPGVLIPDLSANPDYEYVSLWLEGSVETLTKGFMRAEVAEE